MISAERHPVTSLNKNRGKMIDCGKVASGGRQSGGSCNKGLLMMVLLIVVQLNCSTVSGAALTTTKFSSDSKSDPEVSNHNELVVITTSSSGAPMEPRNATEVAPSSLDVELPSEGDEEEGEEVRMKVTKPHIYSSLREKTAGFPESCADYEILAEQPTFSNATWKKCCPEGEYLMTNRTTKTCIKLPEIIALFRAPIINATFFDNCIEDSEIINFTLPAEIYIPQKQTFQYDEADSLDHLYILQNGSLLIVFENMLTGYEIHSDYCLDLDPKTHTFVAMVRSDYEAPEIRTGVVLSKFYKGVACILTISFCCLIVTSALYMIVPRFGTLHGRSFALHALNLALGYVFTASMYFKWEPNSRMEGNEYLQYFISAAFMWQFTMCVDTVVNVWYYIPKKISPIEGKYRGWIHFAIYVLFSQTIPFLFIINPNNDTPEVNYYMSSLGDDSHNAQWRFFGPILAIIILCVAMFAVIYFGFRKLNSIQSFAYIIRMKLRKQKREEIEMPFCSKEMEYVKDSARATCFLFVIQSLCFISEMISFYTENNSSIFFELLNALQGVFILVLFVMFPKPMQIIRQCWAGDQGSLVVEQPHRPLRREEVPLNNNIRGAIGEEEEKA